MMHSPTISSNNRSIFDVVVLGAGAAGLFCAFTAAQRGRRVLVLEKANKVGKKILMSGGGRCNFTNRVIEPSNYISNNPHFCKSALKRYTQWDFIAMVEQHGIPFEERKHSQLFCLNSAKDILAMLLDECAKVDVQIETLCDITSVNHSKNTGDENQSRYQIVYHQNATPRVVTCQSVVVATGALSIPTLGGSGKGYDIAQQFGLNLTERRAGLVPFMFSDNTKLLCERLSGISLEVEVSCNGHSFTENLLFTHRGMSGPVMLQISNYWHAGDALRINLLPTIDASEWLVASKQEHPKSHLHTLLSKMISKPLAKELQALWWADTADKPLTDYADKTLRQIGDKLNNWIVKPSATEGYRTAEVTLGGVDTNHISSKTMEAKQQPGLFFIGEVVDVSGHLGGFNFQWAWSSGYCAGLYV